MTIDLVSPFTETERGNNSILVLTDQFSRWQDAIPLMDATSRTVAEKLNAQVFCYFGLQDKIHTDRGAQFQSELMMELYQLWKVEKTQTTSYHSQGISIVERMNRTLGDSLRSLLLGTLPTEWDLLLPHIMRAFRASLHAGTGETATVIMMGREIRQPGQLTYGTLPDLPRSTKQYAVDLKDRLESAHDLLRHQQLKIRSNETEEPLLYMVGDLVLLENWWKKATKVNKLYPKFVGPYTILEVWSSRVCRIERNGQQSVQNELRLKPFQPCLETIGEAPVILEPNM